MCKSKYRVKRFIVQEMPIDLKKVALKRTSNALLNMKIVDLD